MMFSMTYDSQIQTEAYSWRDWSTIGRRWEILFERSQASFFLSREWVETWLEIFGEQLEPEILVFALAGETVGACLLVHRIFWRKCVPMRRVYLNCAGEAETDGTCIEYNRLMCVPGHEPSVSAALRQYLGKDTWDEFILAGTEAQDGTQRLRDGAFRVEVSQRPTWYVDLAALRRRGLGYEATLSSNVRKQVRRCIRLYQEISGPVSIQSPVDQADAFVFFEDLVKLHQKSWGARGKPGIFASNNFRKFHHRLIERSFHKGRVHLLRLKAGVQTIGLLYLFLYAGRIYVYQSGFAYRQGDNRAKPGFVAHFLAINHYLTARPDVLEYDFLAGDSHYKRSLAKSQRTIEWTLVQRPTVRVRALEILRQVRYRYANAG
jgi:GNAT acetyltransferase-like protein